MKDRFDKRIGPLPYPNMEFIMCCFLSLHFRILVFKDQGKITGQRHVEISEWFGELESTFYKHPKSPHPDVFRVSNDPDEGCMGVGRTGWHVDGSFQESPFSHSLYYMECVPKDGPTGMK